MTKEETAALNNLKKAIKSAHGLGIRLAGMDGQLLYATAKAFEIGKVKAAKDTKAFGSCYSNVASAVSEDAEGSGTLDKDCYEDSGGW